MPNDVYYGQDCEMRVGITADATSDPATWWNLEFKQITITPTRERVPRPLLGRAKNNKLDPIKPRAGLFKLAAELIIDADSNGLARALQMVFGPPTTTGPVSAIYTHKWSSGAAGANYFALQIRTGAADVRTFRGMTGAAISLQGKGDQVSDYDIALSLRGLTRDPRAADFIGSAPAALPASAPASRLIYKVDDGGGLVAASNVLSASWQWDRQIIEDAFLSSIPALSGLRPDGGNLSGQCQFRAVGSAFDTYEEGDSELDMVLQFTGLPAGHDITFEHPKSELAAAPLPIDGPGEIERSFGWSAYQDATHAAAVITVKNGIASFAS